MTIAELEERWDNSSIIDIENRMLQGIFGCRTPESVEASVAYAKLVSSIGLTAENYPLFLKMLEIENHWVIDALIGERDPFLLLSPVQPNRFIVNRIFAMLTKWHRGGVYAKNISVILGVLQAVYSSPKEGCRIYPLSIADLNSLGKHLIKENGQDDPQNRVIMEILDHLSELESQGNADLEEIAIQAAAIRNAFLDNRKHMEDVIPPVLLVKGNDRQDVAPRTAKPVAAGNKNKTQPKTKRKKASASKP